MIPYVGVSILVIEQIVEKGPKIVEDVLCVVWDCTIEPFELVDRFFVFPAYLVDDLPGCAILKFLVGLLESL